MVAGKFMRENVSNNARFDATCRKGRKYLVSLDIGQHNVLEIFSVKKNIASEISKELLNDSFVEFDGSSRIKNIITDRLNLAEMLQSQLKYLEQNSEIQ